MNNAANSLQEKIKAFFSEYELRVNNALQDPPVVDVEGAVAAFGDYFVGANPQGVLGGPNDDKLRTAVPQGYAFYRNIGTKYMRIASLDISPLDTYHEMVKVHWDSLYQKKDGKQERIEFDVIYLLQILDKTPKIFAYITGDEQKVLKEHGLI